MRTALAALKQEIRNPEGREGEIIRLCRPFVEANNGPVVVGKGWRWLDDRQAQVIRQIWEALGKERMVTRRRLNVLAWLYRHEESQDEFPKYILYHLLREWVFTSEHEVGVWYRLWKTICGDQPWVYTVYSNPVYPESEQNRLKKEYADLYLSGAEKKKLYEWLKRERRILRSDIGTGRAAA